MVSDYYFLYISILKAVDTHLHVIYLFTFVQPLFIYILENLMFIYE